MEKSNKIITLLIGIFFFLIIILEIFNLFIQPMTFDESAISLIANSINHGRHLYLDIFDHKPPLNYYSLSFLFSLFGVSANTTHFLALIYFLILLSIVFLIILKISNYQYAFLFTSILSLSISGGLTNEVPMTIFGLLGISAYVHHLSNDKDRYMILAGIFIAFSIWFKQPAILFFISIIFHMFFLFYKRHLNLKDLIKKIIFFTLGVLIVSIPLLIFSITNSNFSSFYFSIITFNTLFKGTTSRLLQIGKLFNLMLFFWPLYAIILFSYKDIKRNMENKFLQYLKQISIILIILFILFLSINKEIFVQHIYPIVPFILFLSVISLKIMENREVKKIILIFLILFLFSITFIQLDSIARNYRDNQLGKQEQVADYIKSLNSLKIFSTDPQFYFLTNETCDYKVCFIAPSVASVFNFSDFCDYSIKKDYLVLTHRKSFLGQNNLNCIENNFILINNFENVGESYVEIWKNKLI
jgi:hypothetical protein